jgi:hypothetical protein
MRSAMLMPLACLVLRAGDPWVDAQAGFRRELQPGYAGCLVYLERPDATSLRIRVLGSGTRLGGLEGEFPGASTHAFRVRVPRGSADLRVVTVAPEGPTLLRLKLQGEAFSPEVVLRVPRPGETESVLLQSELGPPIGSKSN